jgi:hypothetical protein
LFFQRFRKRWNFCRSANRRPRKSCPQPEGFYIEEQTILGNLWLILLLAWVVANAWYFVTRPNHPVAGLLISLLVLAVVIGVAQLFKEEKLS